MSLTTIDWFFYIFAGLGALCASRVITAKNPITAALSLVLTFFCVASIYALMGAHFIAAIQILVYAGAVMVLFTFVIMLLNADLQHGELSKGTLTRVAGGAAMTVFFAGFIWLLKHGSVSEHRGPFSVQKIEELGGNSRVLSEVLFSDYILPFELTSVLLLVGIVGSVALAKRAKKGAKA